MGGGLAEAASGFPAATASSPDEAQLTRLANEMFAQLPGGGGLGSTGLQPSGVQAVAPSAQSVGADVPGAGALRTAGNTSFRPSAHGASFPGAANPKGVPAAVPLPGEAELRSLLGPSMSRPLAAGSPAAASASAYSPAKSAGGFNPAPSGSSFYFLDEGLTPRGSKPDTGPVTVAPHSAADMPLARAPGLNSSFRPSAHGASISGPTRPIVSPSAIPLPGETELRGLQDSRLPPPESAESFTPAVPGSANRPSTHGATVTSGAYPGISPSPIELPWDAEVRSLLEPRVASPRSMEPYAAPAAPGSQFYFLDESRMPRGSNPATVPVPLASHSAFDANAVRRDFPILSQHINGHPLIWLDNAATTQK